MTSRVPCSAESSRTGGPLSVSTGPTFGSVGIAEMVGAVLSAMGVLRSGADEQATSANAETAPMVRMPNDTGFVRVVFG